MTQASDRKDHYLADFDLFASNGAAAGLPWIQQVRRDAIARFADIPFPTTRDEEWRFTNVTPIVHVPFRSAHAKASGKLTIEQVEPFIFGEQGWTRMVFVDGRYAPELSSISQDLDGVLVGSLAEAINTQPELVERHLGRHVRYDATAFTALNTAFVFDGAFVHVPNGKLLEEPIHLIYISTASESPTASYPRNLIIVERAGRAEVIESYVSTADGKYFTNAVTEAVLGEGAVLKHYKIQQESDEAYHIASIGAHQERDSVFTSVSITLGSEISRNKLEVVLDGEGSECVLDGLYLVHSNQLADNHLAVDHAKPHCPSHQLYKGILDGTGRAVFNGKIIVRQDAQRTDAKQTNRNLLLSEGAVIDTKPQLEIFADDVKCTHGATVGQLDEESIFYLTSRGINRQTARTLLTYGFASDLINRITIAPLRVYLNTIILDKLHVQPQVVEAI